MGRRAVAGHARGCGSSTAPPPCGSARGRAASARRRSPGRPRASVSARRDEPVWVNSSSTVQARITDADPAGRSRTSRANADEHRRHAPLDVARASAVEPALRDRRLERRDRHPVGRHGILMGVEEDRPPRRRGLVPRQQVVAARRDRLPLDRRPPARGTKPRGSPSSAFEELLGPTAAAPSG